MKRLILFSILLSFSFSSLLISQTYEDGMSHYKEAALAKARKESKQKELEGLEKSFKIFESLASRNDYKSLIMCYLLSIKLGKPFSLQDDLFQYVKNEYPNFPTVAKLKFYWDDKTVILNKFGEISKQKEQLAQKYVEEAKTHANLEEYQEALGKLNQAEEFWKLAEVPVLRDEYNRLKKEKEQKMLRKQIENLKDKQQYQEALDTLNKASGILSAEEIFSLETEIKTMWFNRILEEARRELKKKSYYKARNKCDEAFMILPEDEALKLKKKIQKIIDRIERTRFWAFFADLGSVGALKKNIVNFDWNGNSDYNAVVTDSGTVKLNPESESKFSFNFGALRMFSRSLGLSASVSFFKQPSKTNTDYKLAWTFWTGESDSVTASMSDGGRVTLTTINLNLLTFLELMKGLRLNLYGGPTLFLANIDLSTCIGYGGPWEYGDLIYIEWFPFQYKIKESSSYLGGNIGLDLEYKISLYYSVYLGVQYFGSFPKSFRLQLVNQSYSGQMWDFFTVNPNNLDHLPDYKANFNISYSRFYVGVKVFL